jgi:hypothetical protein
MAGDHVAVMIDEGRDREAKGLDRAGELPDLLRAALAGVARIELQLVDPAKGDLERRVQAVHIVTGGWLWLRAGHMKVFSHSVGHASS